MTGDTFPRREGEATRMRATLAEWADVAEDVSNDFATIAHCLREAGHSRNPAEALGSAGRHMADVASTIEAWAAAAARAEGEGSDG